MPSKLERLQTQDEDLRKVQENVAKAVEPLLLGPFAGAVLTNAVTLGASAFQLVPHGLGRIPSGWLLVAPNAGVLVWEDSNSSHNADPTAFLFVIASAAVTCRFLVF